MTSSTRAFLIAGLIALPGAAVLHLLALLGIPVAPGQRWCISRFSAGSRR